MKNILIVTFVALFALSFGIEASAQIQTLTERQKGKTKAEIKELFARTPGVVDAAKIDRRSRTAIVGIASSDGDNEKERFPLGEEPVFVLGSNHQFVDRGETVEINLYPMITSGRNLYAYTQLLRPGNDGEYDGSEEVTYFNIDNGNYGHINSIQVLRPIKLASWAFNIGDKNGRYTFNTVIVKDNGRLVQQIIYDVYLVNAGRWDRFFYAKNPQSLPTGVSLTGRFPVATPIYYALYTKDAGATITGPDPQSAAISDGSSIMLYGSAGYNRTTPISIAMWSPQTRYAWVLPEAFADEASQP